MRVNPVMGLVSLEEGGEREELRRGHVSTQPEDALCKPLQAVERALTSAPPGWHSDPPFQLSELQ